MSPKLGLAVVALVTSCGSQPTVSFDSYEAMAAALKGTSAECQDLVPFSADQVSPADERYLCPTSKGTIRLAKYQLPEIAQEDMATMTDKRLVVGPNWIVDVTGADADLADVVAEALGGEKK